MTMSDEDFFKGLCSSIGPVHHVASWLIKQGYMVRIRPTIVRPDFKDRFEYDDGGDLDITMTINVKARTFDFTSAEDFPYKTIMLDEARNIKANGLQTLFYISLNKAWTHCSVVRQDTKAHWVKREVDASNTKDKRTNWECPVGHAEFYDMREDKDKGGG